MTRLFVITNVDKCAVFKTVDVDCALHIRRCLSFVWNRVHFWLQFWRHRLLREPKRSVGGAWWSRRDSGERSRSRQTKVSTIEPSTLHQNPYTVLKMAVIPRGYEKYKKIPYAVFFIIGFLLDPPYHVMPKYGNLSRVSLRQNAVYQLKTLRTLGNHL